MQFKKVYKQAIAAGTITTSFRAWNSPQAKLGGQYNIPPFGAIKVDRIEVLPASAVSAAALARAELISHEALYAALNVAAHDEIYQVDFHFLGEAPVKQVNKSTQTDGELERTLSRLARMDKQHPWTTTALQLITDHPGTRAGDLAPHCEMDTATFKRNVRKLKALGLTISLETGYKLSPRGEQVLEFFSGEKPT